MGFLPNSSWSWWFGLNVARCGQDYINIDLKNIFKCRLVCAEDYGGLGLNSVIKWINDTAHLYETLWAPKQAQ